MSELKDNISEGKTQGNLVFKSQLGDFTETQEKLLLFGSSGKMLTLLILHLISIAYQIFVIIGVFNLDTSTLAINEANLTILKVILLVMLVVSLIVPVIVFMIYNYSKKLDTDKVIVGLDFLKKYTKVILGFIILFAIFSGIMIVIGFFSSFFSSLGLGILAAVFYYVLIISLLSAVAFLDRVVNVLMDKTGEQKLNDPSSLKLLFFILLVFVIIQFIKVGVHGILDPTATSAGLNSLIALLAKIKIVELISNLLSIVLIGFTIYLIGAFAAEFDFIRD